MGFSEPKEGKAEEERTEDGDVQHLGSGSYTRREAGEKKNNVTRVTNGCAKSNEGEGTEYAESAGEVIADGNDHYASHDGGEGNGLHERT